jgi:hypothetical protein
MLVGLHWAAEATHFVDVMEAAGPQAIKGFMMI